MLVSFDAYTQVIKGTILDKDTKKPIDYAQIYFAGSFAGTGTDKDGNFELNVPKAISLPLSVSALGYFSVSLSDYRSGEPLIVYLAPKVYELNEFVIKSANLKKDKRERERYLIQFRNQFLGKTPNARFCKILNEDDIGLFAEDNVLKAFSSKPILIENRALGYKITFFLDEFKFDMKKSNVNFKGNILFNQDMDENLKKWKFERQRKATYYGSKMHFFRSLWDAKLDKEHFIIRDSLKILSGDKLTGTACDSTGNSIKYLKDQGAVWVDYGSDFRGSRLEIEKDTVYFDRNGTCVDGIRWFGEMGKKRIAEYLPIEYMPSEVKNLSAGKDQDVQIPSASNRENKSHDAGNLHPDQFSKYSPASFAEKIYLQLDGKVYTTDKTIWFKAIVTNAVDHAPSTLSRVLYVELIDPDERIIEKKLIKIDNGIGDGFFDLNQSFQEGLYMIRAYTEWDKNYDDDFFFKEYIRVFAPSTKVKADPISNITLTEKQNSERRINASFDPFAIDSLHKKDLTLFATFDNKKDSFLIKRNSDNKYLFDYTIPINCQFVTLQIQTKNLINYTKTIVVNEDHLDVQFFPESGELVHGLPGKVGFKALDYNGKGKFVEGEIVNQKDEVITQFKSNQLGMGSFMLASADTAVHYFARLKSQSGGKPSFTFPLPHVSQSGNVLSVMKYKDKINLLASSNYLKNDSIFVQVSCRGMVYFDIKGRLKEGTLLFSLPANQLPEGIIAFTMMDNTKNPVAERLYFNERPESRINIALSTDKNAYSQREPTKLNIETTNCNGEAVNANLSLLVLNKDQLGQIQSTHQNILSYFLLSSDLKGAIENPGYYFSKDQARHNDLDALLLTQGWRKYNYTRPADKILFQPESNLTVSGSVSGEIFNKKKKGVELTMMTFGKTRSFQSQITDSLGRFKFNLNDEYGQNLNVLIQSAKKSGVKMDYTIALDKKESPAVSFNHVLSVAKADSVVYTLVEKNIERKKVEDSFRLTSGNILLPEVVVEAYRMTPERKKVMEEYGKPTIVIEGKDIQAKEQKWSYGLFSVLMYNFPDQIEVKSFNGVLYARVKNPEPTLFVIDGIPISRYDYISIPNIPPSEVKSFEVIPYANNFLSLFFQVYPFANPLKAPTVGNVIAIYTYGGKGIYGASRAVGIVKAAVPVFSASKEFYAPKYENLRPEDWFKPDLRALVHWDPKLKADSLGKISTAFYNADNTGEMQVVVEAISDKGEIGYQELDYKVKKSK